MSGGYTAYSRPMPGLNVGYARVSTDQRDLTAQRDGRPMPLWYGQPYRRTHACPICGAAVARDDAQHEPPFDHPARHAGPVHLSLIHISEPTRPY